MNKISLFLIHSVMVLGLSSHAVAQSNSNSLSKAEALYNKGECAPAIREFQNTLAESKLSPEDADKVRFKIAYCQFNMDQYAEAETGFKNFLQKYPNDDEAKLKYSQSLLYQGKHKPAKTAAEQIKNQDYQMAAAIVIARAQIETEDASAAIKTLHPFTGEKQAAPEALYWQAVAQYNSDMDEEAEKTFERAKAGANSDSWVKSESQAWIQRLQTAAQKFHIQLTAGYINDSNIAQSGGSVSFNPGQVGGQKPVVTTNYISDKGPYAALDLYYKVFSSRKSYLNATLSGSSPYYKENPSYNSQSFSFDLSYGYIASKDSTYGLSLKYLESLYNNVYSQDYFIATPFGSWMLTSDLWLKFSVPATMYLNGKNTYVVSPSLDSRYSVTNSIGVNYGASYTKSFAPKVTIVDVPPATVTEGTVFTHYTTLSYYVGFDFQLPWDISFSLSDSISKTNYELEDVPVPPGGRAPNPREDTLNTLSASLSQSFIKDLWSGSLSGYYYDNKSTGFLGIASSGSATNNTYTRTYMMISTTLYY